MRYVTLLALQAAATTAAAPDARLLHPLPAVACHATATEIVVCGKDSETYRLPKTDPALAPSGPPEAEWGLIGGTTMRVHGEQRSLGSAPTPAAMATVTIPF